jgi:predicted nuclease of predicted toxin-antitoxin system
MTRFLADENVPPEVIEMIRQCGMDVTWVKEISPGADDDSVLGLAHSEGRVLITFDKDFGEMAFRLGKTSVPGVLLLRPRLRGPDYLARFVAAVLAGPVAWEGHFCVAREGRMRVVPMPE